MFPYQATRLPEYGAWLKSPEDVPALTAVPQPGLSSPRSTGGETRRRSQSELFTAYQGLTPVQQPQYSRDYTGHTWDIRTTSLGWYGAMGYGDISYNAVGGGLSSMSGGGYGGSAVMW